MKEEQDMKKTRRHILGMLVLFMVMTFAVQITSTQPVYAARVKSVKYAKRKLLKKVHSYKSRRYPRNKKIFVYYHEKRSKKIVWFYLGISQGDGAPDVGIIQVNLKTGRAKLIEDYYWERVKLRHGSYKIW